MLRQAACLVLFALVSVRADARAQHDSGLVSVHGVAFDSIRNRPLADAFVAVRGVARHAQTDAKGRFELDSLRAGTYTIIVQHPSLDTLGFTGLSARSIVPTADEVRVTTPSYATLWKRVCGDRRVPDDSGFVFGVVRDVASKRPIAEALVSVVWLDSLGKTGVDGRSQASKDAEAFEKARRQKKLDPVQPFNVDMRPQSHEDGPQFQTRAMRLQGFSDSTGSYRICGVPRHAYTTRIAAVADTLVSDTLDVRAELGMVRRDIRMLLTENSRPSTLAGQLTDRSGNPVPYARVNVAGAGEARSDDSGTFVLRNVDPGTRLVEVRFIGMAPTRTVVDLQPGDSSYHIIVLDRVPMLNAMSVKAAGLGRVLIAEFESRRRIGLGTIVDSTFISRYNTVENVVRELPGLIVRRKGVDVVILTQDGRGGFCEPTVYLDGLEANPGHLLDLTTTEAVAIESYIQPLTVPTNFIHKGTDRKCGVILAWTKYAFKNR